MMLTLLKLSKYMTVIVHGMWKTKHTLALSILVEPGRLIDIVF